MPALSATVTDEPIDVEIEEPEEGDTYWAAKLGKKMAAEIRERAEDYYDRFQSSGLLELCDRTHSAFYGLDGGGEHTSSQVVEFGEDGEKLGIRSNQLRSLVKFVYLSATSDTPTIKPRATNNTARALAQVPTARKVLEYYDRVKKMQRTLNGVALRSLLYGKGYLWQSWDPSIGPAGPDGKPLGDLLARACSPLDVACDIDVVDEHDWFTVRVRRNRWDLAAIYADVRELSPEAQADLSNISAIRELRTQILNGDSDILETKLSRKLNLGMKAKKKDRDDSIYEYHFMHRRTPALPQGRYVIMIPGDIVLFEGDLPYESLPIDAMCPEEFLEMGSCGYSSAWDLLGMQDAYDAVMSACITNHEAFAHNDILLPEGTDLGYEEIRDGLNVIRFPMGEHNRPSMLEKFSIKDEAFKLKDWLKGDMELALSVNSVARGEPEASLESGAALALVQAQAIQAQSPFVQAFNMLVADSSTNRIKILKKHLQPDRVIAIAGGDDPDSTQAFSVQDIDAIDRIEVESVNPLFRTIAGKQNAADKLLERDLMPSASAYLHFQETGRLELITDEGRQDDLFGHRVKEILMTGPAIEEVPDPLTGEMVQRVPECRYMFTDPPQICLKAAKGVLRSFENRKNQAVILAATAYMSEVFRVWQGTDPARLALLEYPLPPAPVMPGEDPNAAPAGAPPGQPKGKPVPAEKPTDQGAPPEGTSMPSMPKPAQDPMAAAQ